VISKWEQRGANMSVWQGLAEETEAHWERLLKEKETLSKQVQQKFAFATSVRDSTLPSVFYCNICAGAAQRLAVRVAIGSAIARSASDCGESDKERFRRVEQEDCDR
jgi:hypothetical protein